MSTEVNTLPARAILSDVAGQPVRIHVLDAQCRELVRVRLTGTVLESGPEEMEIELHEPFRSQWNSCILVVEVIVGSALVRFETRSLESKALSSFRLRLDVPNQLQSLQRRKHPRLELSLPLRFHSTPVGPSWEGNAINLSVGGLAFTTAEPVCAGERLILAFTGPDGLQYDDLLGEVIRVTPSSMPESVVAIRFVDLHPAVEAALAAAVEAAIQGKTPAWHGRVSWG